MNILALTLLLAPQSPPTLVPLAAIDLRIDYGYQTQVAVLNVPTTQMAALEQETVNLVVGNCLRGSATMAVGTSTSGGVQTASFYSSFMIDSDGASIELSSMYAYTIVFDTGGAPGVIHVDFENYDYVYNNRFRLGDPGAFGWEAGDPIDLRQSYDLSVPQSASNTFSVMFVNEIYIESTGQIPTSPAVASVSFIPNALPVTDNSFSVGVAEPYATDWERSIDNITLLYTMPPLAVAFGFNSVPTPIGITNSLLYPSPVLWADGPANCRLTVPTSALTGMTVFTQPVFYYQNDIITGNVLTLRN